MCKIISELWTPLLGLVSAVPAAEIAHRIYRRTARSRRRRSAHRWFTRPFGRIPGLFGRRRRRAAVAAWRRVRGAVVAVTVVLAVCGGLAATLGPRCLPDHEVTQSDGTG